MFVNNTVAAISITAINVNIGTCNYHGWAGATSLGPNSRLIITQTKTGDGEGCTGPSPRHFDTSDIGKNKRSNVGNCTHPDGIIPTVSATIDGKKQTFSDTKQVLNTRGIDPGSCPPHTRGSNESTQWSRIGTSCPTASLTLAPPTQTHPIGTTAKVTATLVNGCGQPLSGAAINFSVLSGPNMALPGSGTTDSNGQASFSYLSALPGTDVLDATIANPAGTITSNTVNVTWVGGYLAQGSFVIADTSDAIGHHVTFWGAQWAAQNMPSGGNAPTGFKGFTNNTQTSPPKCGQTWTTSAGNSPPPPKGPLPTYLAIIVSSSIKKSGTKITGNVVEIVTVKVASGYNNSPGGAGKGTVIGKIC